MKGLQTLIVGKETVLAAVQEYLDKSITPNIHVISIAPYASQYGNTSGGTIPEQFQIMTKPKSEETAQ